MHSLVFVILPSETGEDVESVRDAIWDILGGSDTHPERAYASDPTTCACVGMKAKIEAFRRVDATPEGVEWNRRLALAREGGDAEVADRVLAEQLKHVRDIERAHPLCGLPDPACKNCRGSGIHPISRDARGKWDCWDLGGRWDRYFEPGEFDDPLRGNMALARDVAGRTAQAVVTPYGEWRERPYAEGDAGRAAEKKWHDDLREILLRFSDHRVVVVDCHS